MTWFKETSESISAQRIEELMRQTAQQCKQRLCARPRRVLLLPPDITRAHSGAGRMTEILYNLFADEAEVHVIPTLGQHVPHTVDENRRMFGSIPEERIHAHDWRDGCVSLGTLPAEYVKKATNGAADWEIRVALNRMLIEEPWDLIIHIGHVVPHEVLGFANHNKNYFIGLGGKDTICDSHMAAACCGIENNLGSLVTPVRQCFNKAEDDFLGHLPDVYVQIVMARDQRGELVHTGLYVGDDLETYLEAARQSRKQNITVLEKPLEKVVCVMQGDEFFSTWVANKSIYRTRMALADGGELIVMAPGLKRFGEQPEVDEIIRKYGYCGTPEVMKNFRQDQNLQDFAHAAAHLIHGSSEGRFKITYAPGKMSRAEIESVHFHWADLAETIRKYPPEKLKEGFNDLADGERIFFIPTPSAGLWSTREKLYGRSSGFDA
ncbi:MAG: lactate racemase domain-containing protein [Thermoguttaceae bacterium]